MNLMELCVDAALTLPKVSVGVAINPGMYFSAI